MSEFITTAWTNFNTIIKKSTVQLGETVFLNIEPKERVTTSEKEVVVEKFLSCQYLDEASGYQYEFELSQHNLNQFITLLNLLKSQLAQTPKSTNSTGGCSRTTTLK